MFDYSEQISSYDKETNCHSVLGIMFHLTVLDWVTVIRSHKCAKSPSSYCHVEVDQPTPPLKAYVLHISFVIHLI